MAGIPLSVECHAGFRAEETPRRFKIGGTVRVVVEVLDCWLAPAHRYFKVLADDGGTWILRHDPGQDCWELTMYEGAPGEGETQRSLPE